MFAIAALAAGLVVVGLSAAAQEGPSRPLGVVELFTSQGCSSCPPADEALVRLVERGDVIALGYHVDYWDYLGWRDTLGSRENSERQYNYAKELKRRGVYTPQAIMNGRSHINGGRFDEIVDRLGDYESKGNGLTVDLRISQIGKRMRVSVAGSAQAAGEFHVVVVYFKGRTDVTIERGENAGKNITYVNAVTDVQTVGMWNGEQTTIDIPLSELASNEADGCAVLLQEATASGNPGAIIGAAILPRQSG
ncbi:DUF1223 domain-containing protein [Oricola cellulosilytica]|uniref:DUF1223 domain-containing protein n=1 Tax=Oricola cellulosilytica TaxID=1429082 RepID=A0A4R0PC25_9HYPH|nr:DUF1223 domain-containing protein [Oricola cellulosilytica]TCD13907.1 DUF1223 domain-containing protein [Oricola cellulosilytica]